MRELNNKPHQSEAIICDKCGETFTYLEDEIVRIDGEPVCWDCFDKKNLSKDKNS